MLQLSLPNGTSLFACVYYVDASVSVSQDDGTRMTRVQHHAAIRDQENKSHNQPARTFVEHGRFKAVVELYDAPEDLADGEEPLAVETFISNNKKLARDVALGKAIKWLGLRLNVNRRVEKEYDAEGRVYKRVTRHYSLTPRRRRVTPWNQLPQTSAQPETPPVLPTGAPEEETAVAVTTTDEG